MITNDTILNLYSTFATAPELFEDRGLSMLMDYVFDTEALDLDGDRLVFNTMPADSPWRSIELEHVYGAKELPGWLAVVLPDSIVFVNRADFSTRVHIKE